MAANDISGYAQHHRTGAISPGVEGHNDAALLHKIEQLTIENHDLKNRVMLAEGEFEVFKTTSQRMETAYRDTIHKLVLACEFSDSNVPLHIVRLGLYASLLAEKIGFDGKRIHELELAAPLHDIGKIGVPEDILLKPGKLTAAEFSLVKMHTVIGGNLLANSDSPILSCARQIALSHHEQWNGSGYPLGLIGGKIPLTARIINLLDAFDALTSPRPHKMAYPIEVACDMIKLQRGQQFDPDLVDTLVENLDSIIKIKAKVDSADSMAAFDYNLSERDRCVGS